MKQCTVEHLNFTR